MLYQENNPLILGAEHPSPKKVDLFNYSRIIEAQKLTLNHKPQTINPISCQASPFGAFDVLYLLVQCHKKE